MRDFRDEFEMDEDGRLRRKRKRVAGDGDRISFPMTAMDHAAYGFNPSFADGSPDHTSPHRPGYRFADTDDAARVAAEEAYRERNQRMSSAWQRKGQPQQDDVRDATPRTRTPEEAQKSVDDAYAQKVARLDYRHRRHAT
jgi:hypothetical protein